VSLGPKEHRCFLRCLSRSHLEALRPQAESSNTGRLTIRQVSAHPEAASVPNIPIEMFFGIQCSKKKRTNAHMSPHTYRLVRILKYIWRCSKSLASPNHPNHETILGLKPMVTWLCPILGNLMYIYISTPFYLLHSTYIHIIVIFAIMITTITTSTTIIICVRAILYNMHFVSASWAFWYFVYCAVFLCFLHCLWGAAACHSKTASVIFIHDLLTIQCLSSKWPPKNERRVMIDFIHIPQNA